MQTTSLIVGIGACLVGQPVRFDGSSKRKNTVIESLAGQVTLKAFCPEVSIGLGVPRETLRIVENNDVPVITDSKTQTQNHTDAIKKYAQSVLAENDNLCGYIAVKGSPSCGLERVKAYNEKGNVKHHNATGLFIKTLQELHPLLPIEDEGRLHDPDLRENFVKRIFIYHQWLARDKKQFSDLLEFWRINKYAVMAHDINSYKAAGRLLADAKSINIEDAKQQLITIIMTGLKKPATRKSNTNVLQHITGYLKKHISSEHKQELQQTIDNYRLGHVPLVVPMTLLQHHFSDHPSDYIAEQVFMQPYPKELQLRNQI